MQNLACTNADASGTYFGFTCSRSSVAFMKATRGKAFYTYKPVGPAFTAPASKGEFHLNWDVNPPGDVSLDSVTVPEPNSMFLLLGGMLALGWVMRKRVMA